MAIFEIPDIRIAGLSTCVPKKTSSNHDYNWISQKERDLLIRTIGVETRHIAEQGQACSDLCLQAAEQLLDNLGWERGEINLLILVSQSRDFIIPSTSAILQDRMKLPKTCMTLDINLGCSGYVYGLSVISSLMCRPREFPPCADRSDPPGNSCSCPRTRRTRSAACRGN